MNARDDWRENWPREAGAGNKARKIASGLRRTRVGVLEGERWRFLLLLITFKHGVGCLVSKTHQRVERRRVHLCKKKKPNNLITVMRAAALYHCDPRGIASLVHHRNSIILSRRFSGPPSASQMKSAFITNALFKSTFCPLSHYSPFLSPAAISR